ncbi:MAG: response regulator [Nannocystaceae bacterium]
MTTPCIILADDEPAIRRIGQRVLRGEGVEVHTAENGKRATELVDQNPHASLVILDLVMPVMSGEQAYQQIRKRHPEPWILLVTGHVVSQGLSHILRDPRVSLFQKPYSIADFVAAVNEALSAYQASKAT